MQAFTRLTGIAAPLLRDNIDTDVIIPIERLISQPRAAIGPYCFEALRYRADGSPEPAFILNQPPYERAVILLAGANFACGSSREHAVWALQQLGLRCVVAPSFGDIFYNNCFQNGMLPVRLDAAHIAAIAARVQAAPEANPVTVDLEACRIEVPGLMPFAFDIAPRQREGLLDGIDAIGLTLKREQAIRDFYTADRVRRPWIYV